MRVGRLLSLVGLLQSRGSMTAEQLAVELGVSPRTVYRDVEALAAAGVRLDAERGPAGGYRMPRGSGRALLALTRDDVEALVLSSIGAETGDAPAAALTKLLAALGPDAAARAGELRTRFLVVEPQRPTAIAIVARAVREQRAIALTTDGRRVVHQPFGMVKQGTDWHVMVAGPTGPVAVPLAPDAAVELLDDRFDRPSELAIDQAWEARAAPAEL